MEVSRRRCATGARFDWMWRRVSDSIEGSRYNFIDRERERQRERGYLCPIAKEVSLAETCTFSPDFRGVCLGVGFG